MVKLNLRETHYNKIQDRFIPSARINKKLSILKLVHTDVKNTQYHETLQKILFSETLNDHNFFNFPKNLIQNNISFNKFCVPIEAPIIRETITTMEPELTVEAPDLINDFYLNLLDWSSNNIIAVYLSDSIYLYNEGSRKQSMLRYVENLDNFVTSISWNDDGELLALGKSDGTIDIYDTIASKNVKSFYHNGTKVFGLSWNNDLLTSGLSNGEIVNHDIRSNVNYTEHFRAHNRNVCGLKWSPDGKCLASGSDDNVLKIWQKSYQNPIHSFDSHKGTIKAIAWAPFNENLLASGGGIDDGKVHFWNIESGKHVNVIDVGSQVSSVIWSRHSEEFVVSSGYNSNYLNIWDYKKLRVVKQLQGHASRVLYTSKSPDGTKICSASADGTIMFWKTFKKREERNPPFLFDIR